MQVKDPRNLRMKVLVFVENDEGSLEILSDEEVCGVSIIINDEQRFYGVKDEQVPNGMA